MDIIHNIVLDRYMYHQIVRVKRCMSDLNIASLTGQLRFKLHLATKAYFIFNTLLNQSTSQSFQQVFIFIPVVCIFPQVVRPFYDFWHAFCTAKSYVWVEEYDTREAPDRRTRRMMEAENKKKRDAAKKERNEEIRVREQLATVQRWTCLNFD